MRLSQSRRREKKERLTPGIVNGVYTGPKIVSFTLVSSMSGGASLFKIAINKSSVNKEDVHSI